MSKSVRPYGQQPTRLLSPQDSLGKNTGEGCHFLLQQESRDGWKLRKGGDQRLKKKYQHTINFSKYAYGPNRLRIEKIY